MFYWICILCCFLASVVHAEDHEDNLIVSRPDQIASLSSDDGMLVAGLVSPLSGQLCLRETDIVARGAQNISVSRTYVPPYMPCAFQNDKDEDRFLLSRHLTQHYRGWVFLPHLYLQVMDSDRFIIRVNDPSGVTLDFELDAANSSRAVLASAAYGISNAAQEMPSGRYDPRNTRIISEDNGRKITVYSPDGSVRYYLWKNKSKISVLEKEVLPNGKVLKYHYDQKRLVYIESLDPQERYVYASIRVEESPLEGLCRFLTSNGATAEYRYEKRTLKGKLQHKHEKTDFNFLAPPILMAVSSPVYRGETSVFCDRFLLSEFRGKESVFNCRYASVGDGDKHYQIDQISLPVGPGDAFQPVYELTYEPPKAGEKAGSSKVTNSDGTYVVYRFSKNLLTTSIEYYGQDGQLKKEKQFHWLENNWLQAMEVRDGQKQLLYRKGYFYDSFGNPIVESFAGDLTGDGSYVDYTVKREFSQDGRNLLLREENEDGKVVCYKYLPSTNLVTAKFTKERDKILIREFFDYSDCNNLDEKTIDDGATEDKTNLEGVSQRTLTRYIPRQEAPFLHMPEWVEEHSLNGLEKKVHLNYDQAGNVCQEDVYDSQDQFAYSIYKEYNERGDLLSETNALGQKERYQYDEKGCCIAHSNFSERLLKQMRYDANGRLRENKEIGAEGFTHLTSYDYDLYDHPIRKTDLFNNSTQYVYDPFAQKATRTDFPPISSSEGKAVEVVTCSTYDAIGREINKTDARGLKTYYRYNAYGSPVEAIYPNGSKETWSYARNGLLKSHTDQDGLTIFYSYDILGRLISKKYENIAEESFVYNSFQLMLESDKEGNLTRYSYDGAGRKVREEFSGSITDNTYDSLGRLSAICKHNGDNTLLIHLKRDLLGRIIEEDKADIAGNLLYKISYAYDANGNRAAITRSINDKEATEAFFYDALNRLVEHRDALGNVTKSFYNENHVNALSQKVLQKTTIDPKNIVTVNTKDALGNVIRTEVLNPDVIACQEMTYDPCGNLLLQKDHIYTNGAYKSTQLTKYSYSSRNEIESLTRAAGTSLARTTYFTYTSSGYLQSKTLPNGTTLIYDYNPLGFLQNLSSSDGKINHAFEYNRLGHLLKATDGNRSFERDVNAFGKVLRESFSTGIEIEQTYDCFNRPLWLRLDTQGSVSYQYDPLSLRKIERTSKDLFYAHRYDGYDLDGNLTSESLIDSLGQVIYATDAKGRKASISGSYFSQNCRYDGCDNLIQSNHAGKVTNYAYDGLSQLVSENELLYGFDSNYNRTEKNGSLANINDLNELLELESTTCAYDLNGNQILKKTPTETFRFTFDPLNRLVEAASETTKICYAYDPLDRRLSKQVHKNNSSLWEETECEYYLYDGSNEIGALYSDHTPKQLRILGINPRTSIAIELDGQLFVPIYDSQDNIRHLIDISSHFPSSSYDFTTFGEQVSKDLPQGFFNPWQFASKRLDPELGLIYFGKRYYDPQLARWLTTDPAGFIDGTNLYQYVKNNPFRYYDPDGQFLLAIPFALPVLSKLIVDVVAASVAIWGIYETNKMFNEKLAEEGITLGVPAIHTEVETEEELKKKKPPYSGKDLGDNPAACPAEGFKWKGKGHVGGREGSWHNAGTKESLYPDLSHPPPKKPHWDYKSRDFPNGARLNLDGTWELKIS